MSSDSETTRLETKTVLLLLFLSLAIPLSLHAQAATNKLNKTETRASTQDDRKQLSAQGRDVSGYNGEPVVIRHDTNGRVIIAPVKAQVITTKDGHVISPEDLAFLRAKGYTDAQIEASTYTPPSAHTNQVTLSPTPPDLKNAIVSLDSFLGMTNAMLPADVIRMKPQSLKFRTNGKDYDYSGNYTVMLNTPRQHKAPYFGFGSPETAKIVILEDFGGQAMLLQNATIWEKKANFIDVVALKKEWIRSGTYTIQN